MKNSALSNDVNNDGGDAGDSYESDRLEDHKLWPNARLGLLHLVEMLKTDEYRFEPTPKMKIACCVTLDSHWKKCHQLMRDWLADRGIDLVNHFSREGGYAIARQPVQTFRELLKSTFRALGHLGSAQIRTQKLGPWLLTLPAQSSVQFMLFKQAMGYLMSSADETKKNIRQIEKALPELEGVGDEVANIPDKLCDPSRAKFIQPENEADFDLGISALEKAILATRAR